ncbi:uncharacterized protein K460DRAFT_391180 [Cucurbitaria berberidis CBS 394.84]|uniref:Uncharacterized protein n=1 Tax=Cucurbitaria berberidis CBS 394.84 TaxID=1168544 RepID=A0A9P4GT11_9PLEO|nr:uncharacterized protein K460DRAFT_391180 [Cucurbitaria berberidis CBS 394.84]KAF1850749.1 hypothetical protein K460DRAFT_391180 [Cucurbitaria berberidis CBS 394.84]
MDRGQPYLYQPSRDSMDPTFNPKRVTMASRMPPPSPKKKQDGPLINFNQHPDSFLFVPYDKSDVKPMHRKTKTFVKVARWAQLFLRVCSIVGAVGILLCGIFIRGVQDTEGYIMRIPPGVDIVVCLYAVYHLVRNSTSRSPASSASYHFFALITDAGFIPFYIFTVVMSRRNSDMVPGTVGRWRTMFPTDDETNKVLTTTWLTATAVAAMHLVSMSMDLYLAIVFKMIANLPADMNPLEDNLTSRRKSKHKHKNSSISAITHLTGDNEKRFSVQSTIAGDRNSPTDPLISKDIPNPSMHQVAFLHTRVNSETTYSPHTPNSARQSKERFSMYSQPPSTRQSRKSLNHRDDLYRQEDISDGETLAQRKSFLAQQANIKRHSRNDSSVTLSSSKQDYYTPPTTAGAEKAEVAGDLALQRNSRGDLQNDNWFIHPDQENEREQEQDGHYPVPAPRQSMFGSNQGYNTLSPYDDVSDVEEELEKPMIPQPLRMNPPTPPPVMTFNEKKNTPPPPAGLKRTQTTTSVSTDATFDRSHSRSGTPKSRYYGDLRAATQSIRNGGSPSNSPHTSPTKGSFRNQPNQLPSATKHYAVNTPSPVKKDLVSNSPFTLNKKSYTSVRRTGEANYSPVKGQSPRVVSRSGVDYINPYEFDDSDLGTPGRRRDVSGKIAEEGRGGVWGGMTQRKVSGFA